MNGRVSDSKRVQGGPPEGFVLRPILCLIDVDNLLDVQEKVMLLADDAK